MPSDVNSANRTRVLITQKVRLLWTFTVKNEKSDHMSKNTGNGNQIFASESTGLFLDMSSTTSATGSTTTSSILVPQ